MLIGLTGEYCAGKNHVAKLLSARGCEVLDVDKLGYVAIENKKKAIVDQFGEHILCDDGSIDRRKLGAVVFGMPDQLAALEAIVHPEANRLTDEWIQERPGKNLVINAALLHRSTAFKSLSFVILVRAPFLTRLFRAKRRDKLPLKVILERFRSQKHFTAQYFEKCADIHIVYNKDAFGFLSRGRSRTLERRIDSILDREGMVR